MGEDHQHPARPSEGCYEIATATMRISVSVEIKNMYECSVGDKSRSCRVTFPLHALESNVHDGGLSFPLHALESNVHDGGL